MRVSLRWLRQHLSFPLEVKELHDALTSSGLEIEASTDLGMESGLIVIGEVKTVERHPRADKLTVCQVDTGGERPLTIVCGATNHRPGDRVPVALPGAVLPNGVTLRKSEIRGVASEGMMCSPAELHWSDDATGILILPPEWKVGEPLDHLFDVSITPNRPDCMSIHGLARDLAAVRGKKVFLQPVRVQEHLEHVEQFLHVSVKDRDLCPRYCARLIRGVRVGPSPLWLARALESVGMRSINNIVDVTNFVLMELGHPLHAFDAEMITDRQIIVRPAKEGETLTVIDGTQLTLHPEDLVIADTRRPLALAGVMGGANSEVTESTGTVILESAYFDPLTIRRTSKRHGLSTESSQRFERGADREMALYAINRAAQLIRQVAGGDVARGVIDIQLNITETKVPITLRLARVHEILGLQLPHTEIADHLVHLGCEIPRAERERFFVMPPSWRVDLQREIDLIEEIARLHGYSAITSQLPQVAGQPRRLPPLSEATGPLTRSLLADGFQEVVNYSFMALEPLLAMGHRAEALVTLRNPLTRDLSTMRPAVLPSVLFNIAHNLNRGARDLRLFEIGTAYDLADGKPREWAEAVAVLAGERPAEWNAPAHAHDFHDIKGVAERCLRALGISQWQVTPLEDRRFHPRRSAALRQGPHILARLGELHPEHLEIFDIRERVCALEMPLAPLAERARRARARHRDFSRHPAIERDLALVVDETVAAGDLLATIREAGGELLESVRLFDLYRGDKIETGKKSLAHALVFRAPDRTLREEEVQEILDRILAAARARHGATLRS